MTTEISSRTCPGGILDFAAIQKQPSLCERLFCCKRAKKEDSPKITLGFREKPQPFYKLGESTQTRQATLLETIGDALGSQVTKVSHLYCRKIPLNQEQSMNNLVSVFSQVSHVVFLNCNLTDASVVQLSRLKKLKVLALLNNAEITPESIRRLENRNISVIFILQ